MRKINDKSLTQIHKNHLQYTHYPTLYLFVNDNEKYLLEKSIISIKVKGKYKYYNIIEINKFIELFNKIKERSKKLREQKRLEKEKIKKEKIKKEKIKAKEEKIKAKEKIKEKKRLEKEKMKLKKDRQLARKKEKMKLKKDRQLARKKEKIKAKEDRQLAKIKEKTKLRISEFNLIYTVDRNEKYWFEYKCNVHFVYLFSNSIITEIKRKGKKEIIILDVKRLIEFFQEKYKVNISKI